MSAGSAWVKITQKTVKIHFTGYLLGGLATKAFPQAHLRTHPKQAIATVLILEQCRQQFG